MLRPFHFSSKGLRCFEHLRQLDALGLGLSHLPTSFSKQCFVFFFFLNFSLARRRRCLCHSPFVAHSLACVVHGSWHCSADLRARERTSAYVEGLMGEKSVFFMSHSMDRATHWLEMPADGMGMHCSVNFIVTALQGWFVKWRLCLYRFCLHLWLD